VERQTIGPCGTPFYDADLKTLDQVAIDAEFERLWGTPPVTKVPEKEAIDRAIDGEVDRLSERSLEELLDAYRKSRRTAPSKRTRSASRVVRTTVFSRDPLVIAIAKKRADNKCEVPGCDRETFLDASGVPYSEVHHVWPLAQDGPDTIENVACLCRLTTERRITAGLPRTSDRYWRRFDHTRARNVAELGWVAAAREFACDLRSTRRRRPLP
jgi:5-methylcytosine-specific restriction endonuclease McrA